MLGIRTIRRLVGSLRRRGSERDLDDELGFHLAMRIERNTRAGMTPDAAARSAHARFGDIEEVKTAMRKANRPTLKQLLWSPTAIGAIATLLVTVGVGMWFMGGPPGDGSTGAGGDITMPRPVERPNPNYTPAAMEAKIQGAVIMTCVVQVDGACTDIDVVESLDTRYGLDNQATEALAKWRFEPGARHDEPVPVSVTVEMTFTLR
jgi:TonB family protein